MKPLTFSDFRKKNWYFFLQFLTQSDENQVLLAKSVPLQIKLYFEQFEVQAAEPL